MKYRNYTIEKSGSNYRIRDRFGSYIEGVSATRTTAKRWIDALLSEQFLRIAESMSTFKPEETPPVFRDSLEAIRALKAFVSECALDDLDRISPGLRKNAAELLTRFPSHPEGEDDFLVLFNRGPLNLRLLTAAPCLLKALQALLAAVENEPTMQGQKFDDLGIQVHAAIAKAKGEA